MKVAILSVQVPFISGGAEMHTTALRDELRLRGCQAEIVTIPFKWYPPERLLDCMLMARLIDVEEVNGIKVDRVIAMKFPAYFAPHPRKVSWIMHQHRQAYDLYGTPYSDLWQTENGRQIAAEIKRWDDAFLPESQAIFANSKTVARRLEYYNHLSVEALYHPPFQADAYHTGRWDNYILYPGRFDSIKRQHLIFEAMAHVPDEIHLVLCGDTDSLYGTELRERIARSSYASRIKILGVISEREKVDLYANCLAVYNGVVDEDYGYVTLEAFFSGKPVITHTDSGGPLEFVRDGQNGFVTEPDSFQIAAKLTELAQDRAKAKRLGDNARQTIERLNITWEHAIDRLLSS